MFTNQLSVLIAFAVSFAMVILVMPSILQVAKGKDLFYQKVDDSNRLRMIPLGGIAVFIGLMLGSILGTVNQSFNEIKYIIVAFALAGSLLAQLIYTAISKRRATQVGETGAKIVGLIISLLFWGLLCCLFFVFRSIA